MRDLPTLSRRALMLGGGLSLVATALRSPAASAQSRAEQSKDGFATVRAEAAALRLRGPDEPATPAWTYGGVAPGPLLRVRRGEDVRARLVNALPDPTALHWHGMRLPNAMDGAPHLTQAPVAPGASFDCRFTARDAGTFWYHAPAIYAGQLARGLAGPLIVDEPEPPAVDADVLMMIGHWRFTADGSLDTAGSADQAREQFTVNGAPQLDIPVRSGARLRLRLVNATEGRVMAIRLEGHQAWVMAIDGQPSEPFEARDARAVLGPGNRVDLFVDAALKPGERAPVILETTGGSIPLARLVYAADAVSQPRERGAMPPLARNPLPSNMEFARALRRDVALDPSAPLWRSLAQAAAKGFGAPLFSARRGQTVMLALRNRARWPQSVHLHGHHCRLLDALDDGWKPYWLDTVLVAPEQIARIAFVADNPGKWCLDWQPVEHRQEPTAAWFEVS